MAGTVKAVTKEQEPEDPFRIYVADSGGSLRFVAGGHQDSAPWHMGGHVLDKNSCVESLGLKTAGQIHAHKRSICPVPGP